ncbi:MAG: hypothetical protein WA476_05855 [Acidobacteriaceae bacterium]
MRPSRFPVLLLAAPICALALLPATSIAAEKFDGHWMTIQDCPAQGKMEELVRKIPTTIDGNSLKGEKGAAAQPGYEIITGKIGDDGNAKLDVNGVLANRANAHGLFAHKGEDYHYTVKAHFDAGKGAGTRDTGLGIESRPCSFTFEKQSAGAAPPASTPASAPQ